MPLMTTHLVQTRPVTPRYAVPMSMCRTIRVRSAQQVLRTPLTMMPPVPIRPGSITGRVCTGGVVISGIGCTRRALRTRIVQHILICTTKRGIAGRVCTGGIIIGSISRPCWALRTRIVQHILVSTA